MNIASFSNHASPARIAYGSSLAYDKLYYRIYSASLIVNIFML